MVYLVIYLVNALPYFATSAFAIGVFLYGAATHNMDYVYRGLVPSRLGFTPNYIHGTAFCYLFPFLSPYCCAVPSGLCPLRQSGAQVRIFKRVTRLLSASTMFMTS